MKTPWWWAVGGLVWLALTPVSASAGQLLWNPGGNGPSLVLSLGDGAVRKTLSLPSGASSLALTLRKFLLPEAVVVLTWKTEGRLWTRTVKKIPGAESTFRFDLPPGPQLSLEIATLGGTSVASITLRRN